MSYRLYWRRNDGVGGHVWLSSGDLDALATEMAVQGMAWPAGRVPGPGAEATVSADEVDAMVEAAQEIPVTIGDARLWLDWLVFLEGAARNGGLLIRA